MRKINSPPLIVNVPAPKAPVLVVAISVPADNVVVPVNVLFPDTTQVPAPLFVTLVLFVPLLSTITPII